MSAPTPPPTVQSDLDTREFLRLCTAPLVGANDEDPRVLVRQLHTLEAHDVIIPAVLGWLAQLRFYGTPDRARVYAYGAWGRVIKAYPQLRPEQQPHRVHAGLVNAALCGDGLSTLDLICQARRLPDVQRFGVWRAVLLALGDAMFADADDAAETILALQIMGAACKTTDQWEQISVLVGVCMSLTPQGQGGAGEAIRVLAALDRDRAVSAMMCAIYALRMTRVVPAELTVTLSDGSELIIDRADPAGADVGLTQQQRAIVWGWHVAGIINDLDAADRIRRAQLASGMSEAMFTTMLSIGCCASLAVELHRKKHGDTAADVAGGEG